MGVPITPEVQEFLRDKQIVHLATLMRDSSPQVTPLWVDTDGTHIIVNTSRGRTKEANMRRDARVAFSITATENPYRRVLGRGRVVDITEEGALDHINALAKKYRGLDRYPLGEGEVRVKVLIEPTSLLPTGL